MLVQGWCLADVPVFFVSMPNRDVQRLVVVHGGGQWQFQVPLELRLSFSIEHGGPLEYGPLRGYLALWQATDDYLLKKNI